MAITIVSNMRTNWLILRNVGPRTRPTFTKHSLFHSHRPHSLAYCPSNDLELGLKSMQSQEPCSSTSQELFSSASLSDSLLVENILLGLKQGNLTSLRSFLFRLNPSLIVVVLSCCRENLQLGLKFIDLILLNSPDFKHSSLSLSAMIHMLVRRRTASDAQALILRMVRKSGISRVEVADSLVSTYSSCGSSSLVFDLFVRTYVQAKKLREGFEAFQVFRSEGVCVSINACNSLLGGLVKVGWIDLAWVIYGEVVSSGI